MAKDKVKTPYDHGECHDSRYGCLDCMRRDAFLRGTSENAEAKAVLEAADAFDQHWTQMEEKGSWKPLSLTDNSCSRDLREAVREWRKG